MMRQHLAILCDNKPGVLTHVAGLISRRAINIECINAGYTEEADVTRINIVVSVENRWELDQAVNQLAKLIDVIKVVNLDDAPFISYELAMIKVQPDAADPRRTDQYRPALQRQDRRRPAPFPGPAPDRPGRPYRGSFGNAERL